MTDALRNLPGPIPSKLVEEDPAFADLVNAFLAGMPERLEFLESALRENDFESLRSCAHQLKGSGGGYGYPELTTLAARLEQEALAQQIQACQQDVEAVKDLVSRLVV